MRNTLTRRLGTLEAEALSCADGLAQSMPFGDGRYTIRVANDRESREKAYRLVYRLYLEKEYVRPNASRMWLGAFDALPDTITLLVEKNVVEGGGWKVEGNNADNFPQPSTLHPQPPTRSAQSAPVGALTVVFDSAAGLPADELYKAELDALRATGRRIAEVVSLGIDADAAGGSEVLVRLFNLIHTASRRVRDATDFVITVNPRHVRFYERMMLFVPMGPERSYGKVGGAPAVLLRLPLDTPDRVSGRERQRTLYRQWMNETEEARAAEVLRRQIRPMSAEEMQHFFGEESDACAHAAPERLASVLQRAATGEPDAGASLN